MYLGMILIALGVIMNNYGNFETSGIIVIAMGGLLVMASFEHKDNWRMPES